MTCCVQCGDQIWRFLEIEFDSERGSLQSLAHSERVFLVSYRKSGHGNVSGQVDA